MNLRTNQILLVIIVFFACKGWMHAQEVDPNNARPNIVVILADDLGYGDLSSFGASDLQSPHIDALMKSGMRMNNFYANCPVCSPTRASLLTGRYPELVGVPGVIRTNPENNWGYMIPDSILLPQVLNRAGYHSSLIGKWHLGLEEHNMPESRGFDYVHGFMGDMMDDYYHHRRHGINYMRLNGQEISPAGHATDLFTQWACDFIHARKSKPQPFFLYLAYNAPHTPIQPPQDWLEKVTQREEGIDPKRAKLVALIEHMDEGIGKVMKALRDSGQQQNTIVIFTSDNGGQINAGANNGNLRDGKQSMYEGGLKVPACAVWPNRIEVDSNASARGITMDLFPTICEAANAKFGHEVDGISLLDVWTGKSQTVPDRELFFHRREGGLRYQGMISNALRHADWKLVRNSPFEPLELFNLADDPLETTNLAAKRPMIFRELSTSLRKHIQRGGAVPWQKAD